MSDIPGTPVPEGSFEGGGVTYGRHPVVTYRDTYFATCECGWIGPSRKWEYLAEDDLHVHLAHTRAMEARVTVNTVVGRQADSGSSDQFNAVNGPPVPDPPSEALRSPHSASETCPTCGMPDLVEVADGRTEHWYLGCVYCGWQSPTVTSPFDTAADVLRYYH